MWVGHNGTLRFFRWKQIVTQVIVGKNEDELRDGAVVDWEEWYGNFHSQTCKRTSYNTFANEHVNEGTAFRGNYATIGGIYDSDNDVFYRSQPFGSWTLDTSTWQWVSPVPYPTDGNIYIWSEITYESDNTTGWLQV